MEKFGLEKLIALRGVTIFRKFKMLNFSKSQGHGDHAAHVANFLNDITAMEAQL